MSFGIYRYQELPFNLQKKSKNNNILAGRKGIDDYPETCLDTEILVSKDPYICSVTLI